MSAQSPLDRRKALALGAAMALSPAAARAGEGLPPEERADAVEHQLMVELGRQAAKSLLYISGDVDPSQTNAIGLRRSAGYQLMGQDPRLKPMPEKPTLIDYFRLRFPPGQQHLLQSAALAREAGCPEKVVLACLLHDISAIAFIRPDHGYWAAQMIEPYVDEEVSWAIRYHQALRFYPDEAAGYHYPEMYIGMFGPDYRPPAYVEAAYRYARGHRWYMISRMITKNDLYAFDPNKAVRLEEFTDLIGRHFRQPKEGLGYDNSPAAHMWRTMMAPTRVL
jgi:hypothetical protein